jgi:hypothetical protein
MAPQSTTWPRALHSRPALCGTERHAHRRPCRVMFRCRYFEELANPRNAVLSTTDRPRTPPSEGYRYSPRPALSGDEGSSRAASARRAMLRAVICRSGRLVGSSLRRSRRRATIPHRDLIVVSSCVSRQAISSFRNWRISACMTGGSRLAVLSLGLVDRRQGGRTSGVGQLAGITSAKRSTDGTGYQRGYQAHTAQTDINLIWKRAYVAANAVNGAFGPRCRQKGCERH